MNLSVASEAAIASPANPPIPTAAPIAMIGPTAERRDRLKLPRADSLARVWAAACPAADAPSRRRAIHPRRPLEAFWEPSSCLPRARSSSLVVVSAVSVLSLTSPRALECAAAAASACLLTSVDLSRAAARDCSARATSSVAPLRRAAARCCSASATPWAAAASFSRAAASAWPEVAAASWAAVRARPASAASCRSLAVDLPRASARVSATSLPAPPAVRVKPSLKAWAASAPAWGMPERTSAETVL